MQEEKDGKKEKKSSRKSNSLYTVFAEEEKGHGKGRGDPVDNIIASRLVQRRHMVGKSQKELADFVGVSIQQIQKYEKSPNRISGGRLYKFAKFLKVPIEYFFVGIEEMLAKGYKSALAEEQALFVDNIQEGTYTEKDVINLIKSYKAIKDRNVRKKFLELVRSIAGIAGYV